MKKFEADIETLKEILEHIQNSEALDAHPWTRCLFVTEVVANHENLQNRNPGEQLLVAIAELFRQMMPGSPPKQRLRLDARWCQFGFLAARYFSPVLFGNPIPVSFKDAWEKIDPSILLFVYGKSKSELSGEEIMPYILVGNEPEVTPISTLSDWHRKGLQRLLEVIVARENHLAAILPVEKDNPDPDHVSFEKKKVKKRTIWLLLALLLIGLLLVGGLKAFRIYRTGIRVYEDVTQLQGSVEYNLGPEEIQTVGPLLETLQADLDAFGREVTPFLWLGPLFRWMPRYGCELASAREFLDVADALTDAGVESYHAAQPILKTFTADSADLNPSTLIKFLLESQPQFSRAHARLEEGNIAREGIEVGCLSPYVRDTLTQKIDPILGLLHDALTVAVELPRLMGATTEGPKTYLLLAQNEDELRPTGGFITAAGTLLLQDGQVVSLEFTGSGELEDWSKPYPVAPWQLRQYMNSPVLIFRDANWFPDFPTSALYAEYLYSYAKNHSVDGVIAFDQQMLVKILSVLGPLEVKDAPYPITAGNVVSFMRSTKDPEVKDENDPALWGKRKVIRDISNAIMAKLLTRNVEWERLGRVIFNAFDEHHLLLQVDNPSVTSMLARHGWDGAILPGDGDFWIVLDSNIGFNKTNAVVETSLSYDIDLTDLNTPVSNLTIAHQNNSDSRVPCIQWNGLTLEGQDEYPIDRCYWDYMRVYTISGANLLESNPQSIPADWMIRREAVPARVDVLDDEIEGVQGFGLLKVVPGGDSVITNLRFALPATIIRSLPNSGQKVYKLRIQKQPGTLAVPLTVRVHFSNRAQIQTVPTGALIQDQNVLIETDLRLDREFEIVFSTP